MVFLQGFKWALPDAFKDAIAKCLFTEGDTIYDTKQAYEPWNKALQQIKYDIRIIKPSKYQFSGNTFKLNWKSPLQLVLTNYKKNLEKNYYETTQGRLFTLLWRGELNVLNKEVNEPKQPLMIADIKKLLTQALPNFEELTKEKMKDFSIFIMPYDPTNDILSAKDKKLRALLEKEFKLLTLELTPEDMRLPDFHDFMPTLSLKCYSIESKNEDKIRGVLKIALCTSRAGMRHNQHFNVNRHGLLKVI